MNDLTEKDFEPARDIYGEREDYDECCILKDFEKTKQQILKNQDKANYRDYMIEQYWFQQIIGEGTNWYDMIVKKAEKYDTLMKANSEVVQDNISITQEHESIKSIREYLSTMEGEPEGYIKLSEVYHSIRRMIGDE